MAPESTEKLLYVYRLQQSKLVSISHLTENLSNIFENLESFSAEQKKLAGELESCTNKSRVTIRRLERKAGREDSHDNEDDGLLSPARKKSLLHTLQEIHDISSSVAEKVYRLSSSHKYAKWHLSRSRFGIRIDHDLAGIRKDTGGSGNTAIFFHATRYTDEE